MLALVVTVVTGGVRSKLLAGHWADRARVLLQAFELQVAQGGVWSRAASIAGNNLKSSRYQGPSIAGSALRIRMTKAKRSPWWLLVRVRYSFATKPHPTLGNADGHAL